MPNPEWVVNAVEVRGGYVLPKDSQKAPSFSYGEYVKSQDREDIRDGLSPEAQVRNLRDFDRVELPE